METRKRQPDPAARAWAVLQGLAGRPVSEICGEHGIGEAEFGRWRDEFLSAHGPQLREALAERPEAARAAHSLLFAPPGKPEDALQITRDMIEVLPIPVFYKARDGRYLGVNQAWEDFFGVSRADRRLGRPDLYPHSPAVADEHHAMDEELWANPGSQSYEIPALHARRAPAPHHLLQGDFPRADSAVAGLIGTIIDITERKQAEQRQAIEHSVGRLLGKRTRSPRRSPA